jgi:hypothetical protein
VDENATIQMLNLPEGFSTVSYQLTDFNGALIKEWSDDEVTSIQLENLTPGTYVVKANCGHISVQQDIDFLLLGSPYITVSPNPTSALVQVKLCNPIYPMDKENNSSAAGTVEYSTKIPIDRSIEYVVSDGISIIATGTKYSEEFEIDLSSYPSGIYTISVSDGQGRYAKHLQLIH